MKRTERLSLAWYNLTQDWKRLVLYVAGITIAVLLVFVQLGFEHALMDSNELLLNHLNADLLLISSTRRSITVRDTFSRRRLAQALGVPGVASAHPLFIDYFSGLLRPAGRESRPAEPGRPIRVLGVDPEAGLLRFPGLAPGSELARKLCQPGTAAYDRKPRRKLPKFGLPVDLPDEKLAGKKSDLFELAGRTIRLVGSFELGYDFAAEGTLVVSEETFHELLRRPVYPGWQADQVEIGLIRVKEEADVRQVRDALRARFGTGERRANQRVDDVTVVTPEEMRHREQVFWKSRTPIGIVFGLGVWMGVAVGFLICFQILSGNVYDNLPQYAALLAIGYPRSYLRWLVIQEALILAVAGYLPGWLLAWGSYELLAWRSELGMRLTLGWSLAVLAGTVLTCLLSGLVALLPIRRIDPGDLLR